MDWINLAQVRDKCRAIVSTAENLDSIYWAHLCNFRLTTETEFSLRNVVILTKDII
jgi:hypothetical protein